MVETRKHQFVAVRSRIVARGRDVQARTAPEASPDLVTAESIVFGFEVVRVHENREGVREGVRTRVRGSSSCSIFPLPESG